MTGVTDLLDELRVDYRGHGGAAKVSEGWVAVGPACPFCTHGPWYCGINLRSGAVSCWSCGRHSLADVLAAAGGVSIPEARRLAAGVDHAPVPRDARRGTLVLPEPLGDLLPVHRQYLERRGFDPDELVARWGVRGIGRTGGVNGRDLSFRLFIPIHRGADVVSWTTRSVSPQCPPDRRYNAASRVESAVPRAELLFGEQFARHAVIVVEGPFDVFAVGPGAVASAGTGISAPQIARIARYPVRVIVYDNEPAAQRRARALADNLSVYEGETCVARLSGDDPASSPRSELLELRTRFLE